MFHKLLNVAVTGPRATIKKRLHRRAWALACHTRRREGFPRQRFAARVPHPCRSGSPDPDLFVIRRSQTTDRGNTHWDDRQRGGQAPALRYRSRNPTIAGDRPPRYRNIKTRRALLPNASKYETPAISISEFRKQCQVFLDRNRTVLSQPATPKSEATRPSSAQNGT